MLDRSLEIVPEDVSPLLFDVHVESDVLVVLRNDLLSGEIMCVLSIVRCGLRREPSGTESAYVLKVVA